MTLGVAGVAGNDATHFGRPTDIAFLPDGTFFVTDGYINTRVVKFDKDGRYVTSFGTPGSAPGQFNLPHAIDIDRARRLYVADRTNSRIQVFDEFGKLLDVWPNIRRPIHIVVSGDQRLWVADLDTHKILQYDLTGKLLSSWGTYGIFPGGVLGNSPVLGGFSRQSVRGRDLRRPDAEVRAAAGRREVGADRATAADARAAR